MEAKVYNQTAKEVGTINLPESVFGLKWNADLVHQVVTSILTNRRKPYAHTKNRGDVRGGGKKPWQQKGTGRARHGSIRSPLWVGGGVTHGPRNEKNFARKVNHKMKAKALFTILSKKWRDGEVLFVDELSMAFPKTADAVKILMALRRISGFDSLLLKRANALHIATAATLPSVTKSFRNIGGVDLAPIENINPVDLLKYKYLIIVNPEKALVFLNGKFVPNRSGGEIINSSQTPEIAKVVEKSRKKTKVSSGASSDNISKRRGTKKVPV
jgi:large subunit ribosomal protein L4